MCGVMAGGVNPLRSFIGGTWRDGNRSTRDLNPAHPSEPVADVLQADAKLAAEAVESAASAFAGWRALPAPARGDILRKAADSLDTRAADVGRDLTREEGKTLAEGIGETRRAAQILRYYAGQTLEPDGETYPSHSPADRSGSSPQPATGRCGSPATGASWPDTTA